MNKLLIGLVGKQFTGKTTTAKEIQRLVEERTGKFVSIHSLSTLVKELCKKGLGREDRESWQLLGADIMRDGCKKHFGTEDFWVNCFLADIESCKFEYSSIIICDDVRFPNEVEMMSAAGFKFVKLTVNADVQKYRSRRVMKSYTPEHPTETALDTYDYDYDLEIDTNKNLISEVSKEICKYFDVLGK